MPKRPPLRLRYLRFDLRRHMARKQLVHFVLFGICLWLTHVFLLGDHSVIALRKLHAESRDLTASLAATEASLDSLRTIATKLENDPVYIEQVAREQYLMLRPGEKQYLFVPVPETERDALLRQRDGSEPVETGPGNDERVGTGPSGGEAAPTD